MDVQSRASHSCRRTYCRTNRYTRHVTEVVSKMGSWVIVCAKHHTIMSLSYCKRDGRLEVVESPEEEEERDCKIVSHSKETGQVYTQPEASSNVQHALCLESETKKGERSGNDSSTRFQSFHVGKAQENNRCIMRRKNIYDDKKKKRRRNFSLSLFLFLTSNSLPQKKERRVRRNLWTTHLSLSRWPGVLA